MSRLIHFAPDAAIASRSRAWSASDSHRIPGPAERPARCATAAPETVTAPAGELVETVTTETTAATMIMVAAALATRRPKTRRMPKTPSSPEDSPSLSTTSRKTLSRPIAAASMDSASIDDAASGNPDARLST
jgi:hypothetical protein